MERPKRARRRKPDTSQGGPEATNLKFSGGQGVHREMESEGHEEKYRAVIEALVNKVVSDGITNPLLRNGFET
jgi:hypothetical protein